MINFLFYITSLTGGGGNNIQYIKELENMENNQINIEKKLETIIHNDKNFFQKNPNDLLKNNKKFVGNINKGCYGDYCWNSEKEFFLKVEEYFFKDLNEGKHNTESNIKNKCKKYNISSIAYGFHRVEQGTKRGFIFKNGNNMYSNKEPSNKDYIYIWKRGNGKISRYLKYNNIFESTLDFMHIYKYGFGCIINQNWVLFYKMGKGAKKNQAFWRYYNNLIYFINKFQKENFN